MLHKAWNSKGEMPYRFPRSSIKFQGHTVQNITDFYPNWAFPDYRPVAAFKSLRFALLKCHLIETFWLILICLQGSIMGIHLSVRWLKLIHISKSGHCGSTRIHLTSPQYTAHARRDRWLRVGPRADNSLQGQESCTRSVLLLRWLIYHLQIGAVSSERATSLRDPKLM